MTDFETLRAALITMSAAERVERLASLGLDRPTARSLARAFGSARSRVDLDAVMASIGRALARRTS